MNGMIRRQDALAVEIETADVLPMREELPVSEETTESPIETATETLVVETPVTAVSDVAETEGVEAAEVVEIDAQEVVEADVVESEEAAVTETAEVVEAAEAEEAEAAEAVEEDEAAEAVEVEAPETVEDGEAAEVVEAEALEAADVPVVEATESAEAAQDVGVNIEHLRMAEALLFAASEPLSEDALKGSLPEGANVSNIIVELQKIYENRGVTLARVAEKWQFRTAPDLAFLLRKEKPEQKRLSRAAIETLAIIAYHQPVTRAEIEDIRGVMLSKGTLDTLMEVGWIKIRGRKRTPGRPVTYGTTEAFLVQFGLENIGHLPGMDELKAAGFLEAIPPSGLDIPSPSDQLAPDEDPYDGEEVNDLATGGADPFIPGSSAE